MKKLALVVFVTLQPAHLVFRNLAAEVVREIRPPVEGLETPKVEWREPDTEPASVTNLSAKTFVEQVRSRYPRR
jgi:hypothetical protein